MQRLFSDRQDCRRKQGPRIMTFLLLVHLSLVSSLLCSFSILFPPFHIPMHISVPNISHALPSLLSPIWQEIYIYLPFLFHRWVLCPFSNCVNYFPSRFRLPEGFVRGEPFLLHHPCVVSRSWEGGPLTQAGRSWNHRIDVRIFMPAPCLSVFLFKCKIQTLHTADICR